MTPSFYTNISSSFFQPKPANFISLRVIYTGEVCRENARIWRHLLIVCLHPILAAINFVPLGCSSLIYSQWIHFVLQGILKGEVSLYC